FAALDGQSLWDLHRLGLYGCAAERSERGPVAFKQRELTAAVADAAALGRLSRAERHFERLAKHPLARWRNRRQVAAALAPHTPDLALRWIERTQRQGKDDCADLRIALLFRLGRYEEAARLLPETMVAFPDQPELLLHQ